MKPASPAPSHSLRVHPLGGRLPKEIPVELDLARGEVIKDEPGTVIWRNVVVNGRHVAVKMYRRGFALWLRCLATFFRAQREFEGLSHLEALGIPCTVPVFWCRGHFGPYGWGEILVTEWVDQSWPLRHLLRTRPEASGLLDLSPLFADMAAMHAAGVHHGMLGTKNVLLRNHPESPAFIFIDLPRFHRFPRDIRGKRMAHHDLMSLCEGLLPHFPEDAVHSWLSAYGVPDAEKIDLLNRLKQFRSTSTLRKIVAAEFDVRNVMSRLLTISPRNHHVFGFVVTFLWQFLIVNDWVELLISS
jgi:hypothetical protein